jgi:hypothetical protein
MSLLDFGTKCINVVYGELIASCNALVYITFQCTFQLCYRMYYFFYF